MTRYRLAYLGVAFSVMGAVALVAAESESRRSGGLRFGRLFEPGPEAIVVADAPADNGVETGNLSEAGAREILTNGHFLAALVQSREQPVLLFKHSTSCEISGGAYRRTAQWIEDRGEAAPPVFLVKVIERRSVSQTIEHQTNVKHESPQAILLVNGRPVWHTSHEDITADSLSDGMELASVQLKLRKARTPANPAKAK